MIKHPVQIPQNPQSPHSQPKSLLKMSLKASLVFCLFVGGWTLITLAAQAQVVTQIKGKRVSIRLEGGLLSVGDEVDILNFNRNRVGRVRIKFVDNTKGFAIGDILKTTEPLQIGLSVQPAHPSTPRFSATRSNPSSKSKSDSFSGVSASSDSGFGSNSPTSLDPLPRSRALSTDPSRRGIGVLVGYGLNSLSMKAQILLNQTQVVEDNLNLSGGNINLTLFYDHPINPFFILHGGLTYEGFTTSGKTQQSLVCSESSSCYVDLQYAGVVGAIEVNFLRGKTRGWLNLGYSYETALKKSQNITNLDPSSLAATSLVLVGAGMEIPVNKNSAIPISADYGYYPGTKNVKVQTIYLRTGYLIRI